MRGIKTFNVVKYQIQATVVPVCEILEEMSLKWTAKT